METPARNPIEARGLVKRYGDLVAVDGLDLTARKGSCLGLLGPNGAGKTTTIEMLEGLGRPDAGHVRILGLDWRTDGFAIREKIGVQLQETKLQDKLTVAESLRMFASFYVDVRPMDDVLGLVGLHEKRDARVADLSGGQRQRLALGCALLNRPEILFLDEPTTGLDPQARRRVWEIVHDFKGAGGTVLLTTHYMDEAEQLADDLIIVDHGKIIAEGTPAEIIRTLDAEAIVEFELTDGETPRLTTEQEGALRALAGIEDVRSDGAVVTLEASDTKAALGAALDWMDASGTAVRDIRTHRPTLEDVFVSMTGKHLRDE